MHAANRFRLSQGIAMRGITACLCLMALSLSWAPSNADDRLAANKTPEFDPDHAAKMQEGLELFKSQVRKILIGGCVECHGGGEVESGFDLATRKGLVRGGSHGPAAIPGKSGDSNLVRF